MPHKRTLVFGCAIAALSFTVVPATVGFAEWEVLTPGGNRISHIDGFKQRHGDCLRSESRVWVSHLTRWRYYEGLIIGENAGGFFVFDELREAAVLFDNEATWQRAVDDRDAGEPISPWLTGADGWREAWFPTVVWGHCQEAIELNVASPMGLTVEECRDALAPDNLRRLSRTTWGHECRKLDPALTEEPLKGFCQALLAP